MTQTKPRICVVTCMRNEGQFLLEWVAYYRALGFDEIIVMTNDCDDGTDLILDRLEELGHVTHVQNLAMDDLAPLERGIKRAFAHPKVQSCDWLMLCDADEFPYIDHGDGNIHDLISAMPGHTDCIALAWKAFGTSGLEVFPQGANVLEVNTMAQDEPDPAGFHKSIFRPNKFSEAIDHMPKSPHGPVIVRNSNGQEMNPVAFNKPWSKYRGTAANLVTFEGACMHHYATRADDIFVMKNDRGDGRFASHTKYYKNSGFYTRFNRNDVSDRQIEKLLPAVKRIKDSFMKDPILSDLHRKAIEHFKSHKERVLTPEQLAAWTKKTKS
ncbi:glycosyltransferase family 2 protein [Octadecabacter ascidiaceicola]|uniref:Glycosyl transferase family 2 n=1 Tax=Octadecabacter ascidiaceicola TaxID=1655543 RepID=A0A238K8G2_9RHOB|nr:glycosyltransferase family 2 protein [Octadecabacter ascidiaceicola]SMX39201.1 hypothetical protein OCA8868_01884 [Octadecabacter ascidiaceicola]